MSARPDVIVSRHRGKRDRGIQIRCGRSLVFVDQYDAQMAIDRRLEYGADEWQDTVLLLMQAGF